MLAVTARVIISGHPMPCTHCFSLTLLTLTGVYLGCPDWRALRAVGRRGVGMAWATGPAVAAAVAQYEKFETSILGRAPPDWLGRQTGMLANLPRHWPCTAFGLRGRHAEALDVGCGIALFLDVVREPVCERRYIAGASTGRTGRFPRGVTYQVAPISSRVIHTTDVCDCADAAGSWFAAVHGH